jgi:site-specific DNA-methyltransferase (adenine-specific)
MMERLADYAGQHGRPTHWPYFSLDGETPLQAERWARMRAKWNYAHGITNVWREPALRNAERMRSDGRTLHTNQKPLRLMEQIVLASSDPGDVIWEPFGGLCTAALAALRHGRHCHAAEISPAFHAAALVRLAGEADASGGAGIRSL